MLGEEPIGIHRAIHTIPAAISDNIQPGVHRGHNLIAEAERGSLEALQADRKLPVGKNKHWQT